MTSSLANPLNSVMECFAVPTQEFIPTGQPTARYIRFRIQSFYGTFGGGLQYLGFYTADTIPTTTTLSSNVYSKRNMSIFYFEADFKI